MNLDNVTTRDNCSCCCGCWFRNPASKFGPNQISNSWDIVIDVFVVVVDVVVDDDVFVLFDPSKLPTKFGQSWVGNYWGIVVLVIAVEPKNLHLKLVQHRVSDRWHIVVVFVVHVVVVVIVVVDPR